jgi:TolB-like protein
MCRSSSTTRTRSLVAFLACHCLLALELRAQQCPDGTPPPCAPRRALVAEDTTGVAVFPFRATTTDASEWSEALPDLLSTALDGTAGMRVADPWALWRTLRPTRDARAQSPDPVEAERLARGAGARRFVLGSVAQVGARLSVTVRVYRAGRQRPVFTFAADRDQDSVAALVDDVQLAVMAELAGSARTPVTGSSESFGTRSAQALRAYLAAREALRRGRIAEAETNIDRALALDSTFALAMIDATRIKSWAQNLQGRQYSGLMQFAERAVRYGGSVGERYRLRAQAVLASVRTEGARCAESASRILQMDSTDLDAWDLLRHCDQAYGWQYGKGEQEARRAAERVRRLDPVFVPGLVAASWLTVSAEPSAPELRLQVQRLRGADTTVALVRGTLLALRSVLASEREFGAMAAVAAGAPVVEWVQVVRYLRAARPARLEQLLDLTRRATNPTVPSPVQFGVWTSLFAAEGRTRQVDSARAVIAQGELAYLSHWTDLLLVATAIADVGDERTGAAAAARLAEYVPVDSAQAYLQTRPVWMAGWALAAYHASRGDTTQTRRWHEEFGRFPAGGSPPTWREAIQADLAARLASRRGDTPTALALARRAFELWTIHTDNVAESQPEPAMRFNLAVLYRNTGHADSAEALLRSLVPPTTWTGFYTARASFELAELAAARGDAVEAARRYRAALALWERGDSEIASWRDRARNGLQRATTPPTR